VGVEVGFLVQSQPRQHVLGSSLVGSTRISRSEPLLCLGDDFPAADLALV
jgi:hypothetical protein